LLDENVPTGMKFSAIFTVRTVRDMNWLGTTNGELLAKAASQGFNVMITADRNMYYQQNRRELPVAVLLIPTNRSRLLEQIIPAIEESLRVLRVNQFTVMNLGENQIDWPTSRLHSIEITDAGAKHTFRQGYNGPVETKINLGRGRGR
jgi:hypothetical protein